MKPNISNTQQCCPVLSDSNANTWNTHTAPPAELNTDLCVCVFVLVVWLKPSWLWEANSQLSLLLCFHSSLQTVWTRIVLHKDTSIDRTSLIIGSVCFLSLKTSILGYSRLLKASLLSSSFPPSCSSSFLLFSPSRHLFLPHLLFLNPLPSFSSRLSLLSLLQCNLRPCLIDGVMMKVAGGGMAVPCFLLLWWRRSDSLSKLKSCPTVVSLLSDYFGVIISFVFLFLCSHSSIFHRYNHVFLKDHRPLPDKRHRAGSCCPSQMDWQIAEYMDEV